MSGSINPSPSHGEVLADVPSGAVEAPQDPPGPTAPMAAPCSSDSRSEEIQPEVVADAPVPPFNHARALAFGIVTVLWGLLILLGFASNSHSTRETGGPLADFDQRLEDKVFLATRATGVEALAAMGDPGAAYRERANRNPRDESARCRLVVILELANRSGEAAEQIRQLGRLPGGRDAAGALERAFGRPVTSPSNRTVEQDQAVLQEVLAPWQLDAVVASLLERSGRSAEAATRRAALARAQSLAFAQLGLVAAIIALEGGAGVVVIFLWALSGLARLRASRERAAAPSAPFMEETFDPLLGWCMGPAWNLASVVAGIAMLLISTLLGAHGPQVPFLVAGQLLVYAFLLAVIARLVDFRGSAIGLRGRLPRADLLKALGAFVAAFVVVTAASITIEKLTQQANPSTNPVFEFLRSMQGPGDVALMLLLVGVAGPFFEEILFRGVIYTSMRNVLGAGVAIPLNGLLFAAVHGDAHGLIPLTILGIILAYTFERTRSVLACAVTHGLWNTQTLLATLIFFS